MLVACGLWLMVDGLWWLMRFDASPKFDTWRFVLNAMQPFSVIFHCTCNWHMTSSHLVRLGDQDLAKQCECLPCQMPCFMKPREWVAFCSNGKANIKSKPTIIHCDSSILLAVGVLEQLQSPWLNLDRFKTSNVFKTTFFSTIEARASLPWILSRIPWVLDHPLNP